MSKKLHEVTRALTDALTELSVTGHEALAQQLAELFTAITREATGHKPFLKALGTALGSVDPSALNYPNNRSPRRAPGIVDPFELYVSGEDTLRQRLSDLTIDQLKDIIAEHGMDRDKLAMKWRTQNRLIDRIIETVKLRFNKGEVFRN